MINEDKVILMTQMASYEEHEGKENRKVASYFRGDYVAIQILKSFFCVTIAYIIILALYIFYDLEIFMQDIYNMDLVAFAKKMLLYYLISAAVYVALTYIVSTYRYVKARKSLKLFYKNLKKLNSLYHNEG